MRGSRTRRPPRRRTATSRRGKLGGVTDMSFLFCARSWWSHYGCNTAAASFNEDIGAWDTSGVTTMRYMFNGASAFNQPVGSWRVDSVTSMIYMFSGAYAFDQDLGWCVDASDVVLDAFKDTLCESTSCGVKRCPMSDTTIRTAVAAWLSDSAAAEATYGHISKWDTSGVWDMSYLFCAYSLWSSSCNTAAASFNEDISAWGTSGVTTMRRMFYDASAFNQDLGDWAVDSVTDMSSMFYDASAFDQDLGWCVNDDVNKDLAFYNTQCGWCGVAFFGSWVCPDYDGDGVKDAAPEDECCVSAYEQPFTDACGTTLTEVETSGCCPDDFLLRYSHDIYEHMMIDYTRWDCVSFVDKEACDLKGPSYTWGSCWGSVYDQAAATCNECFENNELELSGCRSSKFLFGGIFVQEAKGKWDDWWYNPIGGMNPYCHQHSCCAKDKNDCCETNAAAVAGAVVVGFAVLAGLIGLYYKCCRKPAIAEPSTPPQKAQPEATSPKEEEATAVAPEAEESPQETLTEEAPPPSPPAKSWFWRAEPVPEPEEAEETLAEEPPPPPAKSWFGRAEPEPEEAERPPPLSPFSALRAERERELETLASP